MLGSGDAQEDENGTIQTHHILVSQEADTRADLCFWNGRDLNSPVHTAGAAELPQDLKKKGTLEAAQHIANHESPRTTKLYDRRQDEISLDEVERILI